MKKRETRKGAAAIYVVIFTTTLLGVITLSFVRIMLAESLRTTNYSLSQSAYNSALAGVEDAKIVLLRNQNCIATGKYVSSEGKKTNCADYRAAFGTANAANNTAKKCNTVSRLLHGTKEDDQETLLQTSDAALKEGGENKGTDAIDQAYTCVKVATYTDDFIATLGHDSPSKLIPLRTQDESTQDSVNRISVQWFDDKNYEEVLQDGKTSLSNEAASNYNLKNGWTKMGSGSHMSNMITANKYDATSTYSNSFSGTPIVPPVLQVSLIQTAKVYTASTFYVSEN